MSIGLEDIHREKWRIQAREEEGEEEADVSSIPQTYVARRRKQRKPKV
jgi:hypothetical protein